MRKVKIETLITKSINRTKLILFKPFSMKKWLCLLLIAYLAGNLGGGSGNFSGMNRKAKKAEAAEQEYLLDTYEGQEAEPEYLDGWEVTERRSSRGNFCPLNAGVGPWLFLGVGILGIVVLIIVILFTWLSSRFKFIWLNSIMANDAYIAEPFKRFSKEGNSLFKFFVVLMFVGLGFFALIALWAYFNGVAAGIFEKNNDLTFMHFVNAFALPLIVLIVGIIVLALIHVLIDNFVVTIMGIDHCLFKPAWKKFTKILSNNKKDFVIYLLVLLGLGIATAVLSFLIAFICIIALFIVAAVLFGLPFLIFSVLLKLKILFIIIAIILAMPFLAVVMLLLMSIGLPFAVFFKSFSLYFLSSLECGYMPLLLDDDVA
ncbi:MAG: hypothetical protein ABIA97_00300 [Candidatus Omnitrophota bacterium]